MKTGERKDWAKCSAQKIPSVGAGDGAAKVESSQPDSARSRSAFESVVPMHDNPPEGLTAPLPHGVRQFPLSQRGRRR